MDVTIANTLNPALRKDSLSTQRDKQADNVESVISSDDIPSVSAATRSVEKVNQVTKADAEELQHAVDDIAVSMNVIQKGLAFNIDEDSGMQVVKVIDVSTGELIRQIPNEEALEIAKKLNEVTGLLMKTEV
ncbi:MULTISPECIES: flagellar protein FlaG [unclassified Shewanella]|uniref:flagellar protein FlaG n=1 Tax=unclassified Shewanella TaxID=196818 RepID=UPI002003C8C0|nr:MULTISPECIES: flagellar protein FlaG [unclassified Shewanella]MCK7634414.1 flagellar protein FlaG [Shewanella sp. JNE17]MCK7649586.1 flagellar protein FlaG [Shewanella sp. JNE8]MCK7657843.1 flagellar protein FlaG [Shewanella sp. JNE4-2]UPO30054.1 flagellar protein FlaG [Shewanella sp. JNE2]